jgi:MerR family transcriptional regulator, redox-sensitive transcriptional activator SoxR
MDASAELSIGEAAARAGVAASALRYWERAGLLEAPPRVGGKRRYGSRLRQQIEVVVLSKRAGFTLAETRVLLAGLSAKAAPPKIWLELASRKLPEIEQTLAQAKAMKTILEKGLRCQCLSLDQCVGRLPTPGIDEAPPTRQRA